MAKVFLTLAFLALGLPAGPGLSLRFNSPLYSFAIEQPEGWVVDVQSVSQIANFVVHPVETSWRNAPAVIFGRFVPRSSSDTLSDFVRTDEERFRAGCAGARIGEVDWEGDSGRDFVLRSFTCAHERKEIVAITEVPSYFGIFILSGREAPAVDEATDSFRTVLEGFRWIETRQQYWHPEAEDRPDIESGSVPPDAPPH